MDVPLEISYDGVDKTEELDAFIRGQADKLDRFHPHIASCRVALAKPHEHPTHTNPYRVRVLCTAPPGHELVVVRNPGDSDPQHPLKTVVRSAFEAIERQLKELADRQRGEVKYHDEPRAIVVRLFTDQGYGFVRTLDGREVYFHRNAVLDGDFDRLARGTEVRIEEAMGDQGPQATSLQIVGKPGEREGKGADQPEA